jgi:hypothetical protein
LFLVRRRRIWMVRRISSSRPMTWVQPALGGQGRQVNAVLLQSVVGALRVFRLHGLTSSEFQEDSFQGLEAGKARGGLGQGQDQGVQGHEAVLELLHQGLGPVKGPGKPGRQVLPALGPLHLGEAGKLPLHELLQGLGVGPGLLQKPPGKPPRVLQQDGPEVGGVYGLVLKLPGQDLGLGQGFAGGLGPAFQVHPLPPLAKDSISPNMDIVKLIDKKGGRSPTLGRSGS